MLLLCCCCCRVNARCRLTAAWGRRPTEAPEACGAFTKQRVAATETYRGIEVLGRQMPCTAPGLGPVVVSTTASMPTPCPRDNRPLPRAVTLSVTSPEAPTASRSGARKASRPCSSLKASSRAAEGSLPPRPPPLATTDTVPYHGAVAKSSQSSQVCQTQ